MAEQQQPWVTGIPVVAIAVSDQDRALNFYTDVLALEKQFDVPLPQLGGRWLTVAPQGSTTVIALIPATEKAPAGADTGIRLATDDAAAMHRHLRRQGVAVEELLLWDDVPPMFEFRDPDGNTLEAVQFD